MRNIFLSGLLIFSSCSFINDSVYLTLKLPVLPEVFENLYSGSLWHLSVSHDNGCEDLLIYGSSAEILVPAYKPLSLTATPLPLIDALPDIKPCGLFLQPGRLIANTEVALTWEGGIMAELLSDNKLLSLSGRINTERLQDGINERCFGNIWALDICYLREKLSSGTPDYYDIRIQDVNILNLPDDYNCIVNNALSEYSESHEKEFSVYGNRGFIFTDCPVSGWIEYSQGPYDMIVIRHELNGN